MWYLFNYVTNKHYKVKESLEQAVSAKSSEGQSVLVIQSICKSLLKILNNLSHVTRMNWFIVSATRK